MPRPNPRRAIASEQNVARRFTYERERRGWSYESLAQRMTDAGCPIQGSALYKIEKGRPRRRITVDELAAFAQVLGEHAQNLLRPVELVGDREADELVTEWLEVQTTIAAHVDRAATLTERLETLAANGTLLAFPVHEVLASGLFREVQEAQERAAASFELFRRDYRRIPPEDDTAAVVARARVRSGLDDDGRDPNPETPTLTPTPKETDPDDHE